MNYFLVNQYYLNEQLNKKFKNKNIYNHIDKHLKKKIYSLNSGLLTNSFFILLKKFFKFFKQPLFFFFC